MIRKRYFPQPGILAEKLAFIADMGKGVDHTEAIGPHQGNARLAAKTRHLILDGQAFRPHLAEPGGDNNNTLRTLLDRLVNSLDGGLGGEE